MRQTTNRARDPVRLTSKEFGQQGYELLSSTLRVRVIGPDGTLYGAARGYARAELLVTFRDLPPIALRRLMRADEKKLRPVELAAIARSKNGPAWARRSVRADNLDLFQGATDGRA